MECIEKVLTLGCKIERQVGVGSFKIDIGVYVNNHQGQPSHIYGLGVECDGASYHSTDEARTRDITRQEILENKGWNIYRVWSTDWFTRRAQEEEKLKEALNQYCGEPSNSSYGQGGHISKQAAAIDNGIML